MILLSMMNCCSYHACVTVIVIIIIIIDNDIICLVWINWKHIRFLGLSQMGVWPFFEFKELNFGWARYNSHYAWAFGIHLIRPRFSELSFLLFCGYHGDDMMKLILDCEGRNDYFTNHVQFPTSSTNMFYCRYRNRSRPMYFGDFPMYHILPSGDREGGARRHNLSILGPIPEQ